MSDNAVREICPDIPLPPFSQQTMKSTQSLQHIPMTEMNKMREEEARAFKKLLTTDEEA
jgi:hypothetical protein